MQIALRASVLTSIEALALLIILTAASASADWPMFRNDPTRSGLAPDQSAAGVQQLWSAELGGSVDSSPAVADDVAFVGNSLGAMHAVSADDGAVLWSFQTGAAVVSSPAVADGLVVFGSVDGFCYAVDAATGEQAWCYRTRGPILSSPAVRDGRVFFGSMDGRMYCLSLANGSPVWQTEAGAAIQCSPALSDDLVLYGDDDGRMIAVAIEDGTAQWEADGSGRVVAAPVISGEAAVFGVMGPSALRPPKLDYLVAVETATGTRLWAQHDAWSVLGAPVIANQRVFFVTIEGYVSKTVARAANLSDGELVWERRVGGVVDSSPVFIGGPADSEGATDAATIAFGCHDGRVYLLDAASGGVRGFEALAEKVYSSPAVSDGRIFIGANDGRLHCLSLTE
jgi:outer membrane protein assembly factor BamB